MKLYGISGLGADKRVFEYLKLDCEFIPVDWIEPKRKEPLEEYALRLSQVIDKDEEFGILGVSFGGLVAVEISKVLNPKFTILISSAETRNELSPILRVIGKTRVTKLMPPQLFYLPRAMAHFLFGTTRKELLNSILDDTDLIFVKWAVNELMNWKNNVKLERVMKIGGTSDKIMPTIGNRDVSLINGGEHFMIVDRADEVSAIVNDVINGRPKSVGS